MGGRRTQTCPKILIGLRSQTTSILADFANSAKEAAATEIAHCLAPVRSYLLRPANFNTNSENRQSTPAHKVAEEIRAAQELEKRQDAEVAAHPFWHARFWTHSPVVLLSLFGGDHNALETPPTEFEKLGGANYGNDAEVRKFERIVSFGNLSSSGSK